MITITAFGRMLHPNDKPQIPAPRSHFIKYAAINKLMSIAGDGSTSVGYEELLSKIGAKQDRLDKLTNDVVRFNELYSFLEKDGNSVTIKLGSEEYWQRVFIAAMKVGRHIFDTPEDKHPFAAGRKKRLNNN
jgi:hypothetical protein